MKSNSKSGTSRSSGGGAPRGLAPFDQPGHPIHVFRDENRELTRVIEERIRPDINRALSMPDNLLNPDLARRLTQDAKDLTRVSLHYRRKEELLFPVLERYGQQKLTQSMWSDDDEVRQYLSLALSLVAGAVDRPSGSNLESAADQLDLAVTVASRIIQQEDDVLFPLAAKKLTAAEWKQIAEDSAEYGYALDENPPIWVSPIDRAEAAVRRALRDGTLGDAGTPTAAPTAANGGTPSPAKSSSSAAVDLGTTNPNRPKPCLTSGPGIGRHNRHDHESGQEATAEQAEHVDGQTDEQSTAGAAVSLELPTGSLTAPQLEAVLNSLPLELTFVDARDVVRYFSRGASRVFPRPKASLGREVYSYFSPEVEPALHRVLDEFRSGERSEYEFWFHQDERYLLVRLVALHDADGAYLGALETVQDVAPLQRITGERLPDFS